MADTRPTKDELEAAKAALVAVDGKYDAAAVDVIKREVDAVRSVAIDLTEQHKTLTCPVCKTDFEVAVPLVHLTQVVEAPKAAGDATPVGAFR